MAVGECNILTSAQFSNICLYKIGASINVCLNQLGLRSLHMDWEVRLINKPFPSKLFSQLNSMV